MNQIDRARSAFPAFAHALALHEAADLGGARTAYLNLIDQPQLTGLCLHQLGMLAAARGEHRVAADMFIRALRIDPMPMAYANLRATQDLIGDAAGATATLIDLGCFLQQHHLQSEAVPVYRMVLQRDPLNYPAHANLGTALAWCGALPEAAWHLAHALALWARVFPVFQALIRQFPAMGKTVDAASPFRVELPPGLPSGPLEKIEEVLTTCGKVFVELEMPDIGLACYWQSIAAAPGYALGHWNLAAELLTRMDFASGWAEYEWRWQWTGFPESNRFLGLPVWRGEPLAGKRVYVWGEQGLGDVMQFVPLATRLPALGAEVILEVPLGLVRLCAHSFPGLRVVPRPDSPHRLSFDGPIDYVVALMGLPLRLGLRAQELPLAHNYLQAPQNAAPAWLAPRGQTAKPRVGLVWAGQPKHANDNRRSLPAQMLPLLLQVDAVDWFSLTVGPRSSDMAGVPGIVDVSGELKDFADTAQVVQHLDLVVTVDTGVAHLAGAMGKPTWLMLPKVGDWRWGRSGSTTPWYPATRIFRQTQTDDWVPVLNAVAAALRAWA